MTTHTIFSLLLLRVLLINKGSRYIFFCFSAFLLFCFFPVSAQQLINNKGNRNQSYPIITETKPEIVNLINQVSQDSIESHIRYMQGIDRVAYYPGAWQTQNWLMEKFESYGLDVSVHYFDFGVSIDTIAGNVVAVKVGSEYPEQFIVISSHYDASERPQGMPYIPGADDNASGTAGVLECARILSQISTKRSILFVPFNAEESPMVGSLAFVEKCASENMNIVGVFNLDMIGYFPTTQGNIQMRTGYSFISQKLFDYYFQVANLYLPDVPTLQFSDGDSYGGDQIPFHMYEYPALYIGDIEYKTPCYHKPCDTIGIGIDLAGVNSLELAKAFTQAALAATAELATGCLPPQNLNACSGLGKITISWDSTGDGNLYKLFKNNVLIKETAELLYEDEDVEIGKEYEYYVTDLSGAPSNTETILFTAPLIIPYSNDFQINTDGFLLEPCKWVVRQEQQNNRVLCNTEKNNENFASNYLSMIEMNWFSIPDSISDITLKFRASYNIMVWKENGCTLEATTDRKTWHKLAVFSGNSNWKNFEIVLNEFIGSLFFQIRFRIEGSGQWLSTTIKRVFVIDDVEIAFNEGNNIKKYETPYLKDLVISPNPTSGNVNITTFQENDYQICFYNMMGKLLFQQDVFQDGSLDISFLAKGTYLVVASLPKHRVAKKLVVQ